MSPPVAPRYLTLPLPLAPPRRRSTSGVPAADCELTAAKRYRTSAVLLGLETPVPGLGGLTPGAPLDLLDSDLPSFSAVKMLLGDTPCGRVAATPAGAPRCCLCHACYPPSYLPCNTLHILSE